MSIRGENGIVRLQIVTREEREIDSRRDFDLPFQERHRNFGDDVQQRIANAENRSLAVKRQMRCSLSLSRRVRLT